MDCNEVKFCEGCSQSFEGRRSEFISHPSIMRPAKSTNAEHFDGTLSIALSKYSTFYCIKDKKMHLLEETDEVSWPLVRMIRDPTTDRVG